MAEHDEVYDDARADRLAEMLRALAERIRELDQDGQLLGGVPELLRLMGDARSEMFHYEVRVDLRHARDRRQPADRGRGPAAGLRFTRTTRRTTNHGGIARRNEALLHDSGGGGASSASALLGYQLSKPATVSIPANVTIQPSDTAGFRGYVKGSDSAAGGDHRVRRLSVPVLPDVRDAADAHDRGAADQDRAGSAGATATFRCSSTRTPGSPPTRRPAPTSRASSGPSTSASTRASPSGRSRGTAAAIFRRYAGEVGLDLGEVRRLHVGRASTPAGSRPATTKARALGVSSTPTLLVGGRLYQGRFDSDAITRLVDSLAPRAASAQ